MARRTTKLVEGQSPTERGEQGSAYVMPAITAAVLDRFGGVGPGGGVLSALNSTVAVEKAVRGLDKAAADVVGGAPVLARSPGEAPGASAADVLLEAGFGQKSGVYSKSQQEGYRDQDALRRQTASWPKEQGTLVQLTEEQTGEDVQYRTLDELRASPEADIRQMARLSERFVNGEAETWPTDKLIDTMVKNGTWKGPKPAAPETWVQKLVP